MTVSNEDRASAAATINASLLATHESTDGHLAVDALIALGWEPRPTVSRRVFVHYQGNIKVKAELYLQSCGIEVSE